MAEPTTEHSAESERHVPDIRPVADLLNELTVDNIEANPLAFEYLDHLNKDRWMQQASAEEQVQNEAYYARAFIQDKTFRMTGGYQRSWQSVLQGVDSSNRPIDVDRQTELLIRRYGTADHKIESFDRASRSDRELYLGDQAKFVVQPEHYYRFPEILGAAKLAEQLAALGFPERADSVKLLIAAYGPVLQRLPATDKSLPGHIVRFIQEEKRDRLVADSQAERHD